ncbi:FBP domain-containing protein [Kineococcus terrestris]|uniref:FBP domain-containing protein n=1 Tax=Kineococcus terrestris TaxID=2044856 RepID=UPI0034DB2FB2
MDVRRALVNCSRGEAARANLAPRVAAGDLPAGGVVGWRDPKAPERGYLVVTAEGRDPVGVALRAPSGGGVRGAAMCDLCRTTRGPGDVTLFAAARAGAAGRRGDTVGVYACSDLDCARATLARPSASLRPDPGRTPEERLAALAERAGAFVATVLATA